MPTADPDVRSCDECRKSVHVAKSDEDLLRFAHEGKCVAFSVNNVLMVGEVVRMDTAPEPEEDAGRIEGLYRPDPD